MAKSKVITLIDIRDKNLLIKSDICVKDLELKKFLSSKSTHKGITNIDIEALKSSNERLYDLLSAQDSRKAIIDNAFSEWKTERPNGVKKMPCELCGNPKSEEKSIIRNILTNNTLQVGTSCIKRFPEKVRTYLGEDVLRIKKYTPKQINNLAEFYKLYGFGSDIFKEWTLKYKNYKLTMPDKYDRELKDIINRAKKYYKEYRDDKLPKEQTINTFKYYEGEFNRLNNLCEKYENENLNNMYICDKKIEKYLLRNNLNNILLKIKERDICLIEKEEAKYIYDINFVNRFNKCIRKALKKIDLKLKEINELFIETEFYYKSYTDALELEISITDFIRNFSDVIYNNFIIEKQKVFDFVRIKNNINNVKRFLSILEGLVNFKKYYFEYNITDSGEQIEVHKSGNKKIAIIDFEALSNEYIKIILLDDKKAVEFLLNKIEKLSWIDKEEKKKYDVGNISKTTRNINRQNENEYNQYESEEEYYRRISKDKNKTMKI